jgi:MerR family transcriptional regulator, copper efflux regulator
MLISEFARATGLSRDTVRFYVRHGLLAPLAGNKGGANPYQVFTNEHGQMARTIRMAQSLGFSLREIAALNVEYQAKRITPSRGAEILSGQLARLEEKAAHVNAMIRYIRAKLAWLEPAAKVRSRISPTMRTLARCRLEARRAQTQNKQQGAGHCAAVAPKWRRCVKRASQIERRRYSP